jgi:serine/threonine protein kinase
MQVAHTDLKLDNIFYVYEDDRSITCKVSDFGLCEDLPTTKPLELLTTTYFKPPNWPTGKIECDPLVFTVYQFACIMASLLSIEELQWPYDIENSPDTYANFHDEFFAVLPSTMFCRQLTPKFKEQHPTWWPIAAIFRENFALDPTNSKYEYIQNFIHNILALEHTRGRPEEIAIPLQRRRLDS